MRKSFFILGTLICLAIQPSMAEKITQTDAFLVFPIDRRGQKTNVVIMDGVENSKTVAFKYVMAKKLKKHRSWALEVTEVNRKLVHRAAFDGPLPPLVHWDGQFDKSSQLLPSKEYVVRLVIAMDDGRLFATPWSTFRTKLQFADRLAPIPKDRISLQVVPQGRAGLNYVYAGAVKQSVYTVEFEPLLNWEKHFLGIRAVVSTNVLGQTLRPSADAQSAFYSYLSLFYLYQFYGQPMTRPNLPFVPAYMDAEQFPITIRGYSTRPSVQVGVRLFSFMLRGFENSFGDGSFVRGLKGASIVLRADFPVVGPIRIRSELEGGYSVFYGRSILATGAVAFTYEGIPSFSPGIGLKVDCVNGYRSRNESLPNKHYTNTLVTPHIFVQAKI